MRRDREQSASDFVSVVWPALRHVIPGGGDFVSTETREAGRVAELLDLFGNVDGFQRRADNGRLLPVAQRTRWYTAAPRKTLFHDFTIRWSRRSGVPTEIDKLVEASSDDDNPMSGWIVTSWVSSSRAGLHSQVLWAAFAHAHFLGQWVRSNLHLLESRVRGNQDGGSSLTFINVDADFDEGVVARPGRPIPARPHVWIVTPEWSPVLSQQISDLTMGQDPDDYPPYVPDDRMLAEVLKRGTVLLSSGAVAGPNDYRFRRALYYWIRTSDAGKAWASGQRAQHERRDRERPADVSRFTKAPTQAQLAAAAPDRHYCIGPSCCDRDLVPVAEDVDLMAIADELEAQIARRERQLLEAAG